MIRRPPRSTLFPYTTLVRSARLTIDQIAYEGIERITVDDIEYAKELGLSLKLLGTAERLDAGISVRVHPAFLYSAHPLAAVNGRSEEHTSELQSRQYLVCRL